MKSKQEIWKLMENINHTWIKDDPEKLKNFFHKDIVFLSQGFKEQGVGIDACIKSYKEFRKISKLEDFTVSNSRIDLFNNTAVVSYNFEIKYIIKQDIYNDKGRDMYIFTKEEGRWMAVWRMLMSI